MGDACVQLMSITISRA